MYLNQFSILGDDGANWYEHDLVNGEQKDGDEIHGLSFSDDTTELADLLNTTDFWEKPENLS